MAKSGRSCQMTLFDCIKQKRPGTTEQFSTKKVKFGIDLGTSSTEIRLELASAVNNETSTAILSLPADPSTPESEIHLESSASSSNECIPISLPSGTPTPQAQIRLPDRLDDIAPAITFSPVQPIDFEFPVTHFSKKPRSFNASWFLTHPWLEYSVKHDAGFCYPCRLFGSGGAPSSRPEKTFTTIGFKDWKHATGKHGILACHANCYSHKQAVVSWNQYKLNLKQGTLISEQLSSARADQIGENRHYIKTVAEILLLCSKQDIALRGHRESVESANRGNFLEILQLLARHDPIVRRRISNGPKNATYTSPDIQNALLNVMGNLVRKRICAEVQKAGMYSILADETKDCSKREQLAIVLRYVDAESGTLFERFLTYVEATSLNAESLSTYIIDTLMEHQLDPKRIISQGYDGASVMSGNCSGVQKRIREIAPQASYVHCYAHCLNLALVDSTRNVRDSSEFFALMEALYVFMSTTKAHAIYLQQQSKLHPTKQVRQLQRLSDTRWACRYLAVDAVCSTFDSILATLEVIKDGDDRPKAVEAIGILTQVRCFRFLLLLIIFWRILSCTKSLSDQLQSTTIDMARAADLAEATIETFEEFRTDAAWEHLFQYSKDVATLHNISSTLPRPQRQKRLPKRLEDGVLVLSGTGSRDVMTSSAHFKISIYFPILDAMLSELQRRFNDKNLEQMKGIQSCNPQSNHFLQPDKLIPLANSYGLDHSSLAMECKLAKRTLAGKEIESIVGVLSEVYPSKAAFPTLVQLLQIGLTTVVSTAQCERSFSALKRIKTYLRSTMGEQRLTDLAVLSIERELSQGLSLDEIVDQFAGEDNNHRIVLL